MKELYEIILHSQLGPRKGTLCLEGTGGQLCGVLSLLGYENPVRGTRGEAGTVTLSHSLRTAVGEHPCRSVLKLSGSTLSGTAELAGCRMDWSGRRLPAGTEDGSRE